MPHRVNSLFPVDASPHPDDDSLSMPDIQQILTERFSAALSAAFGPELAGTDPILRPSAKPEFGDYQANLAMGLGKQLGLKPRDVAQKIVEKLDRAGAFDR